MISLLQRADLFRHGRAKSNSRGKMADEDEDDDEEIYGARMEKILRWRRIANLACLILFLGVLGTTLGDPGLVFASHLRLVQSLFAFTIALFLAVNLLTVWYRK